MKRRPWRHRSRPHRLGQPVSLRPAIFRPPLWRRLAWRRLAWRRFWRPPLRREPGPGADASRRLGQSQQRVGRQLGVHLPIFRRRAFSRCRPPLSGCGRRGGLGFIRLRVGRLLCFRFGVVGRTLGLVARHRRAFDPGRLDRVVGQGVSRQGRRRISLAAVSCTSAMLRSEVSILNSRSFISGRCRPR